MNTKIIGAFEARRTFGKLLDSVRFNSSGIVVEKNGEEVVAIVPATLFRQWERRRAAFFERLAGAARITNLSEADAMKVAQAAVQKTRQEQREPVSS